MSSYGLAENSGLGAFVHTRTSVLLR